MKRAITRLGGGLVALLSVGSVQALTVSYGDFSNLSAFQQNGATAGIADPVTDTLGRTVLRLTRAAARS